jgi:bifunctional DNA-binding transcriptional regulator/antitoxin component of YhaV-PrlF toxin-antitoxin module
LPGDTCSLNALAIAKGEWGLLPVAVRKALDIGPQDQVVVHVRDGGTVGVAKVDTPHTDPIVGEYLAFRERDMRKHPQKLSVVQRDDTTRELLKGVDAEDFDLSS